MAEEQFFKAVNSGHIDYFLDERKAPFNTYSYRDPIDNISCHFKDGEGYIKFPSNRRDGMYNIYYRNGLLSEIQYVSKVDSKGRGTERVEKYNKKGVLTFKEQKDDISKTHIIQEWTDKGVPVAERVSIDEVIVSDLSYNRKGLVVREETATIEEDVTLPKGTSQLIRVIQTFKYPDDTKASRQIVTSVVEYVQYDSDYPPSSSMKIPIKKTVSSFENDQLVRELFYVRDALSYSIEYYLDEKYDGGSPKPSEIIYYDHLKDKNLPIKREVYDRMGNKTLYEYSEEGDAKRRDLPISDIAQLKEILQGVSFGVELETCIHILGTSFKTHEKAMEYYTNCMRKKSEGFPLWYHWRYLESQKEHGNRASNYERWTVMGDESINCDYTNVYVTTDGVTTPLNTDKYDYLQFYPIEIISPKMKIGTTGAQGSLFDFVFIYRAFLYTNNIVYKVNDSQGLHINLSHPAINNNKFVDTWMVFQPLLYQMMPLHRRMSRFAKPLGGADPLEVALRNKYVGVGIKANRIEIRIQTGSMDFIDVYYWLLFCVMFYSGSTLFANFILPVIEENEIPSVDTVTHLFELLFSVIIDSGVQRYILEEYRTNKDESWPNADIHEDTSLVGLITHPWKLFTEDDMKVITHIQNITC